MVYTCAFVTYILQYNTCVSSTLHTKSQICLLTLALEIKHTDAGCTPWTWWKANILKHKRLWSVYHLGSCQIVRIMDLFSALCLLTGPSTLRKYKQRFIMLHFEFFGNPQRANYMLSKWWSHIDLYTHSMIYCQWCAECKDVNSNSESMKPNVFAIIMQYCYHELLCWRANGRYLKDFLKTWPISVSGCHSFKSKCNLYIFSILVNKVILLVSLELMSSIKVAHETFKDSFEWFWFWSTTSYFVCNSGLSFSALLTKGTWAH